MRIPRLKVVFPRDASYLSAKYHEDRFSGLAVKNITDRQLRTYNTSRDIKQMNS